ncbi:MAG: hypothetical protein SNG49_09645 [Rikenellaceae bacterium]
MNRGTLIKWVLSIFFAATAFSSCSYPFASSPHDAKVLLRKPVEIELSIIQTRDYNSHQVRLAYPQDEKAQALLKNWLEVDSKCSYTAIAPYALPIARNASFTLHWGNQQKTKVFIYSEKGEALKGTISSTKAGAWQRDRDLQGSDTAFITAILMQTEQGMNKLRDKQASVRFGADT